MLRVKLNGQVYLDTNVYCRIFDDQSDKRIQAESLAFMKIADAALHGEIVIVSSDYVKFEIEKILDPLKRKDVRGLERTLTSVNVTGSRQITALARKLVSECGLNPLDALHVSSACIGEAHWFLTCDGQVLLSSSCIERVAAEKGYRLKVRNPINYLEEK